MGRTLLSSIRTTSISWASSISRSIRRRWLRSSKRRVLMADDPLVPRSTDPETSHAGIAKVLSLKSRVLAAAMQLPQPFDDSQLHRQFESMFDERRDRGLIARTRHSLVKAGLVERVDHDGGPFILHRVTIQAFLEKGF